MNRSSRRKKDSSNNRDEEYIPEKLFSTSTKLYDDCHDVDTVSSNPALKEVMFDKFKSPFFEFQVLF